jgi:hypothetical protein
MTSGTAEHFVLSVQTLNTPGNSGILFDDLETLETHPHLALISKGFQTFGKGNVPTFMDSGASDTMFVLKSNFNKYTPITPLFGDSAKAVDGGLIKPCILKGPTSKTISSYCAHEKRQLTT